MHINKSIINIIKTYINSEMILFNSRKIKIMAYSLFIILADQISKFLVLSTLGFGRSKKVIFCNTFFVSDPEILITAIPDNPGPEDKA